MAGANPDATSEVTMVISEAEPDVAGPAGDSVPELAETDAESLPLVIGITGITAESDVTGTTDDRFAVSVTGTTEVGTGEVTAGDS